MNRSIHHLHRFNTLFEQDINRETCGRVVESAHLVTENSLTTSTLSGKDIDDEELEKMFPQTYEDLKKKCSQNPFFREKMKIKLRKHKKGQNE